MKTVSQVLQSMRPKCYESRAAYQTAVYRHIQTATGLRPYASIEDLAGNCLVCGEAGRCPGWHLLEEFQRAGVEPFTVDPSDTESARVSAMLCGPARVHVLFMRPDETLCGYYMDRATYRAIDISEDASPADFERCGIIEPAPDHFFYASAKESATISASN